MSRGTGVHVSRPEGQHGIKAAGEQASTVARNKNSGGQRSRAAGEQGGRCAGEQASRRAGLHNYSPAGCWLLSCWPVQWHGIQATGQQWTQQHRSDGAGSRPARKHASRPAGQLASWPARDIDVCASIPYAPASRMRPTSPKPPMPPLTPPPITVPLNPSFQLFSSQPTPKIAPPLHPPPPSTPFTIQHPTRAVSLTTTTPHTLLAK